MGVAKDFKGTSSVCDKRLRSFTKYYSASALCQALSRWQEWSTGGRGDMKQFSVELFTGQE